MVGLGCCSHGAHFSTMFTNSANYQSMRFFKRLFIHIRDKTICLQYRVLQVARSGTIGLQRSSTVCRENFL